MNIQAVAMLERMKALPPRLRLLHLQALIRREPAGSARAEMLAALLRDQSASAAVSGYRAI
jgi:hypothetical protein